MAKKNPKKHNERWPEEKETKTSEFALKCAKLLWNKVKADHNLKVKWHRSSVKEWAKHFDYLERQHGQDSVRILLACHIRYMGSRYWPEAFSGRAFRTKWEQIAAARLRFKKIDASSKQEDSRRG